MTLGSSDTIATTEAESTIELWHYRLGHMSQKGMKELLSKGKLAELKSVDLDMYESCILGKQKMLSFLRGGRALRSRKVKLVHTNL